MFSSNYRVYYGITVVSMGVDLIYKKRKHTHTLNLNFHSYFKH